MSKDSIINKFLENKILVGCITAGVITFVGIVWNLEARVSVMESGKAERAQIVKVHDEDKGILHRRITKLQDSVLDLRVDVGKNTMAREILHKDHIDYYIPNPYGECEWTEVEYKHPID